MADYLQRYADKELEKLGKKIGKTYRQAATEINGKLKSFWESHRVISERMLKDVKDGKITQQDYKNWLRNQVFRGDRWKSKLDEITKVYVGADEEARKMVGDKDKDMFAHAANWQAKDTSRTVNGAVSFDIYDRKTVNRLIRDNPKMLPEWKINKKKDYIWNEKRVQNAVTQGIIQGESVYGISKRLTTELAANNASKMDMFARTAVTGAQNAGRVERMKEADEKYGIKTKKQWITAGDGRVRDTHAELNGMTVDYDDDFKLQDGRTIRFPGDPMADPDLVYNCRCSLIYIPAGNVHGNYDLESHRLPEYESYNEWKQEQREPKEEKRGETAAAQESGSRVIQGKDISATWTRRSDEFAFEIEDVMDAQGFDGKPRVVDADEFDKAVQESSFVAQRSYSAPDQETLDAYRDQLYDGKWYVDCSTGGAQYGQGMYCAADYTGTLTDGIKEEMDHYKELNAQKGAPVAYVETLTLDKSAKIITYDDLYKDYTEYKANAGPYYAETFINGLSGYSEDFKTALKGQLNIGDVDFSESFAAYGRLSGSDEIKDMTGMLSKVREGMTTAELQASNMNIGSFAALHGYDAINAEGHGKSGSYTVILNRTKVIFRRDK